MLSQKDGVFSAIQSLLKEHKIKFTNESKLELTKDQKSIVYNLVSVGLHEGHIVLSDGARSKYNSVDKLRKEYVPGLVSNWIRKDKRLNGNVEHEIKNPGSRSGQGDDKVKQLKNILKHPKLSPEQRKVVEQRLKERQDELKKLKTPEINWEALKDCDLGFKLD